MHDFNHTQLSISVKFFAKIQERTRVTRERRSTSPGVCRCPRSTRLNSWLLWFYSALTSIPMDISVSGISKTYAAGNTVALYWVILISILFSSVILHSAVPVSVKSDQTIIMQRESCRFSHFLQHPKSRECSRIHQIHETLKVLL